MNEAKDYIPGLGDQFQVVPDEMNFNPQAQANSVAADVATLVSDFNALLAKLRAAGIIQ